MGLEPHGPHDHWQTCPAFLLLALHRVKAEYLHMGPVNLFTQVLLASCDKWMSPHNFNIPDAHHANSAPALHVWRFLLLVSHANAQSACSLRLTDIQGLLLSNDIDRLL